MSEDPIKDEANKEVEALLRAIADKMKGILATFLEKNPDSPQWGFSMFLFELNKEQGSTFYISTGQREDFLNNLCLFMMRDGYIVSKPGPVSKDQPVRKS